MKTYALRCILMLILIAALCLPLCACGSDSAAPAEPSAAAPTMTAAPTATPAAATATPTAPTPTPTAAVVTGPQVVITKSPTDESVTVGDGAWFIAHADNATAISWSFTSPDGATVLSADQLVSSFPGIEAELLPEDTLALRNIPLALNGWKVQARFDGSGSSATSNSAVIHVSDYLSMYAGVLENCRYVMSASDFGNTYEKDSYGILDSIGLLDASTQLGYALKDIDGNGVPELLLGTLNGNNMGADYSSIVYALFTLDNGSPVKLFSSFERSRYFLSTMGDFFFSGSGGAAYSYAYIYTLNGTALYVSEGVWTDGVDENGEVIARYSSGGDNMQTAGTPITIDQYSEYANQYAASIAPLPALTAIN